jgi:hypothetical protein
MGRFEQIAKQVSQLPIDRQDVIADVIERAFHGDFNPQSTLRDAQLEDLRTRLADGSDDDIATDEEVEAAFEGLMSRTRRAG